MDAWRNSGLMVHIVRKPSLRRFLPVLVFPGLLFFSSPANAQLVGDAPPPQQLTNSSAADQSASAAAKPTGKKRVSQDFALKGDSLWTDTGIDLQPGERVVITAKGTFRYADAKNDNGPEGLSRGFKDLLRVLPFNDAGRGALIARIGDADTSQAILIGASKDVVSPVTGRLAPTIQARNAIIFDGSPRI